MSLLSRSYRNPRPGSPHSSSTFGNVCNSSILQFGLLSSENETALLPAFQICLHGRSSEGNIFVCWNVWGLGMFLTAVWWRLSSLIQEAGLFGQAESTRKGMDRTGRPHVWLLWSTVVNLGISVCYTGNKRGGGIVSSLVQETELLEAFRSYCCAKWKITAHVIYIQTKMGKRIGNI